MNIQRSIRKKYLAFVLIIGLSLLLLGSLSIYFLEKNQKELTQQREELIAKDLEISQIKELLNNVFFRARGYYAFQNKLELGLLYDELKLLKYSLSQLDAYHLTREEEGLINELNLFLQTYEKTLLPNAIALVQADDYEGLRKLSNSGINNSVNRFLSYADNINKKTTLSRENISKQILDDAKNLFEMTIFVALLLFMILLLAFFQILTRIVNPLEEMKHGADFFAETGGIKLPATKRLDEIGALNVSLKILMKTIAENKTDMLIQNKELIMQQNELRDNQKLLKKSLKEVERANNRLEVLNQLNHSLTFSLNRQELVKIVQEYLHEKFDLDISYLWLVETLESSSSGVTDEFIKLFMEERFDHIMGRLKMESSFSIIREGTIELGLAPQGTLVNDLFNSLTNENGEIIAVFSCSRIANTFTVEEIADIKGLLNRVSLSLERIRLYENNQYERTLNEGIVNTIQEGIFLVGQEGELLQYNQSLYHLLAGEKAYLKGTTYNEWISTFQKFAENPEEMISFCAQAIKEDFKDIRRIQYRFKRKGTKIIDLYAASIYSEGIKTSTIFVNRDITKEYEIDQMKTELISTVSHELRTPLSSILGFSELILSKDLTDERKSKYITMIFSESKRLAHLVDDFLDVQRMESGKIDYYYSEVNVESLLLDVVQKQSTHTEHEIRIDNKASNLVLIADEERMTQVFVNLLSNAIKFSPENGDINIRLYNEQGGLKITIQDYGIGITSDEIPKLFQKFHRIDSSETRKIGGTGLGLSIVKEIVTQHGGEIHISSIPKEETTVHLFFPQRI